MNIEARIQRGRVVIAQAKAQGRDVRAWEDHLARLEQKARLSLIENQAVAQEVRERDTIQAVKISSHVLEDEIWLILDREFIPHDGLACYYPEELPELKTKSPEDIREIHKVKLAFPGCRVIQEGVEVKGANGE
jgi:hypothetical protein|tara:strand:+ start:2491 stop:2892 length:402 start_codon:yes stop_codon:yes gene_type:complete